MTFQFSHPNIKDPHSMVPNLWFHPYIHHAFWECLIWMGHGISGELGGYFHGIFHEHSMSIPLISRWFHHFCWFNPSSHHHSHRGEQLNIPRSSPRCVGLQCCPRCSRSALTFSVEMGSFLGGICILLFSLVEFWSLQCFSAAALTFTIIPGPWSFHIDECRRDFVGSRIP